MIPELNSCVQEDAGQQPTHRWRRRGCGLREAPSAAWRRRQRHAENRQPDKGLASVWSTTFKWINKANKAFPELNFLCTVFNSRVCRRCISLARWVGSWPWTGCVSGFGPASVSGCWEWMEPARRPPLKCWRETSARLVEKPSLMQTGQSQKRHRKESMKINVFLHHWATRKPVWRCQLVQFYVRMKFALAAVASMSCSGD